MTLFENRYSSIIDAFYLCVFFRISTLLISHLNSLGIENLCLNVSKNQIPALGRSCLVEQLIYIVQMNGSEEILKYSIERVLQRYKMRVLNSSSK